MYEITNMCNGKKTGARDLLFYSIQEENYFKIYLPTVITVLPIIKNLETVTIQQKKTYRVPGRVWVSGSLVSPTGLQVRPYPFPSSLCKFRKLPRTRVNNCLNFFFWLLADGHHPVQIFVDEQSDKHLKRKNKPMAVKFVRF